MIKLNKSMHSQKVRIFVGGWVLLFVWAGAISCSVPEPIGNTVEQTTKTIKRTTRSLTRKITLNDQDLIRTIGIFNFENNSLREDLNFQKIFHKGLPEYIDATCEGVAVPAPETGSLWSILKKPPRLETGIIDTYSLAVLGRQLGLNAIVTGSLEDIRILDELRGIWITKDTHHLIQVFIRVEVSDTRTATKLLDETFQRQIEIDDVEYQIIQESDKINFPELNETLGRLLTDVGDSICDTIKDQPWTGYITQIENGNIIIPSGTRIGLKIGDILEVFDSSRIIKGIGGQRFFTPGLKIGEIEIVSITETRSETKLVNGKGIAEGSTVRRKD
ncbi:MAG: hypothetical protein GY850_05600 [bacterium]|nr:hypothetical protein [bacterium]